MVFENDRYGDQTGDPEEQGRDVLHPPGRAGSFKEHDENGRSLAADRRTKAKTVVKKGQGDKGDEERSSGAKRSVDAI